MSRLRDENWRWSLQCFIALGLRLLSISSVSCFKEKNGYRRRARLTLPITLWMQRDGMEDTYSEYWEGLYGNHVLKTPPLKRLTPNYEHINSSFFLLIACLMNLTQE